MRAAVIFIIRLVFIFTEITAESQLEGSVQSECRERSLWILVTSEQMPRFEAVDISGVHPLSEELSSGCGYTISSFRIDSFIFRASYYACFTHNQDDEVFTFRFNVLLRDDGGRWSSHAVSVVCHGLQWSGREVTCEEDYMEVNVDRKASCGGRHRETRQEWIQSFSQAHRMAQSSWQLMFLQGGGQVSSLSVPEAQQRGFGLSVTTHRIVLRSPYNQPQAQITMVDGIAVEILQVLLFLRQKLVVLMLDLSVACTVNSSSFDGAQLLWEIPQVLTPLVGEGAGLESQSFNLGVGTELLDEPTATSRGFSLVQQGGLVQIRVPFGAEGIYRKSLVENNIYKETYQVLLQFQQVFTLRYQDGGSIQTHHRTLRVLHTPPLCRPPFSLNETISGQQVFRVYLGNLPTDVVLQEVWVNGDQLLVSETPGLAPNSSGLTLSPVLHKNGTRAFQMELPFQHNAVRRMYLGGGVVQYSIDVNFTLTILPRRESYHHHTVITVRVSDTFPPQITAQCLDRGISFSVVTPPRTQSLWEVGINQEPLTPKLVAQRGYRLRVDGQRTTLEVPLFSVGYTYEGVTLSNFYATFQLLLRDSKTLEVQTSTSKRCLFPTQDLIVCSADGTMTVVATLTSTWPMVQHERTSLLDRTCRPKHTDGARVLFEFQLDSCGTRSMVGGWYMVYENQILYERQVNSDGLNSISRDSQYRVTVRCFYPLGEVHRLSVDWNSRPQTPPPGFGSVSERHEDWRSNPDCPHQGSETKTSQVPLTRAAPKPGPSQSTRDPAGPNTSLPDQSLSPETQTLRVPHPGPADSYSFSSPTSPNLLIESRMQPSPRSEFEPSGPGEEDPFSWIPDEPLGSSHQSLVLQTPNSLGDRIWYSSLADLNQHQEPALTLAGASGGGRATEERLISQSQIPQPPDHISNQVFLLPRDQIPRLYTVLQPLDHISNDLLLLRDQRVDGPEPAAIGPSRPEPAATGPSNR